MTVTFEIFSALKFLAIVGAVLLPVLLLWLTFLSLRRYVASRKYEVNDRAGMQRRWKEVEALIEAPGEMSQKLAVIEADKLLEHALKAMAMPGETLGERLKFASYKYPKLQEVWWAHRVRNRLVHEASYHLDRRIARKAVQSFRQALRYIGAI